MEKEDNKPKNAEETVDGKALHRPSCSKMVESMRQSLEEARHELATLNGLIAFDGEAPDETFKVNTMGVIAKIDETFKLLSNDSSP